MPSENFNNKVEDLPVNTTSEFPLTDDEKKALEQKYSVGNYDVDRPWGFFNNNLNKEQIEQVESVRLSFKELVDNFDRLAEKAKGLGVEDEESTVGAEKVKVLFSNLEEEDPNLAIKILEKYNQGFKLFSDHLAEKVAEEEKKRNSFTRQNTVGEVATFSASLNNESPFGFQHLNSVVAGGRNESVIIEEENEKKEVESDDVASAGEETRRRERVNIVNEANAEAVREEEELNEKTEVNVEEVESLEAELDTAISTYNNLKEKAKELGLDLTQFGEVGDTAVSNIEALKEQREFGKYQENGLFVDLLKGQVDDLYKSISILAGEVGKHENFDTVEIGQNETEEKDSSEGGEKMDFSAGQNTVGEVATFSASLNNESPFGFQHLNSVVAGDRREMNKSEEGEGKEESEERSIYSKLKRELVGKREERDKDGNIIKEGEKGLKDVYKEKEKLYKDSLDDFYNQGGFKGNINKIKRFFGFRPKLSPELEKMQSDYRESKHKYVSKFNEVLKARGGMREIPGEESKYREYDEEADSTKMAFLNKFILKENTEFLKKQEVHLLTEKGREARDRILNKVKVPAALGLLTASVVTGGLATVAAIGAGFSTRYFMDKRVKRVDKDISNLKSGFNLSGLSKAGSEKLDLGELEAELLASEVLKEKRIRQKRVASMVAGMAAAGAVHSMDIDMSNILGSGKVESIANQGIDWNKVDLGDKNFDVDNAPVSNANESVESINYTVEKGGNLWKITEKMFPDSFDGLSQAEQSQRLSAVMSIVQKSPELLEASGIKSGNVDLIYPGDTLNLEPIKSILDSLSHGDNLSLAPEIPVVGINTGAIDSIPSEVSPLDINNNLVIDSEAETAFVSARDINEELIDEIMGDNSVNESGVEMDVLRRGEIPVSSVEDATDAGQGIEIKNNINEGNVYGVEPNGVDAEETNYIEDWGDSESSADTTIDGREGGIEPLIKEGFGGDEDAESLTTREEFVKMLIKEDLPDLYRNPNNQMFQKIVKELFDGDVSEFIKATDNVIAEINGKSLDFFDKILGKGDSFEALKEVTLKDIKDMAAGNIDEVKGVLDSMGVKYESFLDWAKFVEENSAGKDESVFTLSDLVATVVVGTKIEELEKHD